MKGKTIFGEFQLVFTLMVSDNPAIFSGITPTFEIAPDYCLSAKFFLSLAACRLTCSFELMDKKITALIV
ncbi:MAG TPA: hypothetical protein VGA55_07950, partial [Bacteroidota bacterium]